MVPVARVHHANMSVSCTPPYNPLLYILQAKSNFTLFSAEYIYTLSEFKQMEHCNEFPTLALTQLTKNDLFNSTFFRVT